MSKAALIDHGEQFVVIDGSTGYEGRSTWAWEDRPGQTPRRAYPIDLFAMSVRRTGLLRLIPLTRTRRVRIAQLAKRLLEADTPGCPVHVFLLARPPKKRVTPP